MPGALEHLDAILAGLDGGTLPAPSAIEALVGAQIALRNSRRLEAAMRSSRLPAVKTLGDFDFSFQPSVKREQIESLHTPGPSRGTPTVSMTFDVIEPHRSPSLTCPLACIPTGRAERSRVIQRTSRSPSAR